MVLFNNRTPFHEAFRLSVGSLKKLPHRLVLYKSGSDFNLEFAVSHANSTSAGSRGRMRSRLTPPLTSFTSEVNEVKGRIGNANVCCPTTFDVVKTELRGSTAVLRFKFSQGFTLIEVLVSVAIMAMISVMALTMITQVQNVVTKSRKQTEIFVGAIRGVDAVANELSRAVLLTQRQLVHPQTGKQISAVSEEKGVLRDISSLHFFMDRIQRFQMKIGGIGQGVFFQQIEGASNVAAVQGEKVFLVGKGFYVARYVSQSFFSFLGESSQKSNFRLMRLTIPTEELRVREDRFQNSVGESSPLDWFRPWVEREDPEEYAVPIAQNVIGVWFIAKTGVSGDEGILSPQMSYDSRQLGPYGRAISVRNSSREKQFFSWHHRLPPWIEIIALAVNGAQVDLIQEEEVSSLDPQSPQDLEIQLKEFQSQMKSRQIETKVVRRMVRVAAGEAFFEEAL